jgi:hypothetical protein
MRHFSSRVGAIVMSALCASGADAADCTQCTVATAFATELDEDSRPRWLLSMTFDSLDSRFGVAVGFAEISTPFERRLRFQLDDRPALRNRAVGRRLWRRLRAIQAWHFPRVYLPSSRVTSLLAS